MKSIGSITLWDRLIIHVLGLKLARIRVESDERGASLIEYALLLALIVVVCVGAVAALGDATQQPFSSLSSKL